MELYALAAAFGIVLALSTGGSLGRILDAPLRHTGLLFGAFALQVVITVAEPPGAVPLWAASLFALVAFCAANLRFTGMSVVALGILLNALVVVANGGMPVRDRTTAESPVRIPEAQAETVPWLGEIVPLPGPFDRHVTFGDLVVAVGLVDVLYRLSRRPRLRIVAASRADGHAPPVEDALEGAEHPRVVDVAGG